MMDELVFHLRAYGWDGTFAHLLTVEAADAIERMEKRIAALEAELADVKRERDILAEQVMP